MASSGAILSLDAIGGQDSFLTSNENKESYFNYNTNRHSNFSVYQSMRVVNRPTVGAGENWPFNQSIQFELDPKNMGDLLTNMYISCKLPELEDSENYKRYVSNVGYHLIKKLTFRVDEIEAEHIYGDWIVMYNELFNNNARKRTMNALMDDKNNIIIPLPLFFSRMYGINDADNKLLDNDYFKNYFPLCAIHKQKILIIIEFNPITFFSDTEGQINLDNFTCITEAIVLTKEETNFLRYEKLKLTYNTIRRQPILDITANTEIIKSTLVSDTVVRTLFWFFRRTDFENATDVSKIDHRFNFSNKETEQETNPIMSNMNIFINGVNTPGPSVDTTRSLIHTRHFYKYIQSGLYAPDKDIFSYTFSLKPHDPYPTGELDFRKVTMERAFLQGILHKDAINTYSFHSYYTGFISFEFENGFMKSSYDS